MLTQQLRTATAKGARAFSTAAPAPSLLDRLMGDFSTQNALNEEFPGVPAVAGKPTVAPVKVTTLANGLKVASQDAGGATASLAVHVKAGSRYEAVPGTAAVLEQMAFKSSAARSTAKTARDVEDIGATVSAKAGREALVYSGEVLRDGAAELAAVLADTLVAPKLSYWEVNEEKGVLAGNIAAAAADPLPTLLDGLHAAAFGPSSALGAPLVPSLATLDGVSSDVLKAFLGARVTAGNAVLSAVNVPHDEAVALAEALLGGLPAGTGASTAGAAAAPVVVGGQSLVRVEGGGAAHVGLAFAGPGAAAGPKALAAAGVLQALLGGTGGRPGAKHTRLAKLGGGGFSATAFAFPYSDAGLIGLVGSGADADAGKLVAALAGALKDVAGNAPVTAAELERAKAGYKLAVVAAAETRAGARDDVAAGLLWSSAPAPLAATLAAIDAVTVADVAGAAKAALASPAALAAIGSLTTVPRYDQLVALLK